MKFAAAHVRDGKVRELEIILYEPTQRLPLAAHFRPALRRKNALTEERQFVAVSASPLVLQVAGEVPPLRLVVRMDGVVAGEQCTPNPADACCHAVSPAVVSTARAGL